MKIVSPYDPVRKSFRPGKKEQPKNSEFSRIVNSAQADDALLDELFADPDKVLENIVLLAEEAEKAGTELTEKPTPENFFNYKKCVSLIVKGALRNMEMEERVVQRLRRQTLYKTAQEIDTVLADLARSILSNEKNRIDILQLTGHLKGLIVSLLA